LTLKQAQGVIGGAYRAKDMGLPFNRHIIIHWERLGIPDTEAAWATGRFLKLASDWAATKGGRLIWAWVRENDLGDGSKGSHAHILIHCPSTLPFGRMGRRWLRRITGRPYIIKAMKSRAIGGTLDASAKATDMYATGLAMVLAYMVKGVTAPDGAALGLQTLEPGGRVTGKRAAWSQCLAAKKNGSCIDTGGRYSA
jgi:hypothetical protein